MLFTYLVCFQVLLILYVVFEWRTGTGTHHDQMLRARRALEAGVHPGEIFAREYWRKGVALSLMLASYGAALYYIPSEMTIITVYVQLVFTAIFVLFLMYVLDSLHEVYAAWSRIKQWAQPLSSVLSACSELESLVAQYPRLNLLPSTARPLLVLDFELAKSLVEKEKQRIDEQANAELAAQQAEEDKLACAKLHSILTTN